MRSEISGNKPNTTTLTGDVIINETPYTGGTIKSATLTKTNDEITIPAGAYTVEILNNSLTNSIIVAGSGIGPQVRVSYTYKINEVSKKQDLLPEIFIENGNDDEIIIRVEYPSDSPVNPNAI